MEDLKDKHGRARFAEFEADFTTGELFRHGKKVPIQQKPLQLLNCLLNAQGQLVSRAVLQEKLWPHMHVQRNLSLNTAVRKLRMALGESARRQRLVETVGDRGYRLRADVIGAPVAGTQATPSRVAVLPMMNLGADEAIAQALTENVVALLLRARRNIDVLAPVCGADQRANKTSAQLFRELHCDYIVCGSVTRNRLHLRVTAKLLRGADQKCLWAEIYSEAPAELIGTEQRIARDIVKNVAQQFGAPHSPEPTPNQHRQRAAARRGG